MTLWQWLCEDLRWYQRLEHRGHPLAALRDRHFWVVACYRIGAALGGWRLPVAGPLARLLYAPFSVFIRAISGADVRTGAVIGHRFTVHTSFGLLIADGVRVGDDVTVNNGVCLVNRANRKREGQPVIEDGVLLGVGAKVMGGVTVGAGSVVGANAVVFRDVPPRSLAVGVPATVKPLHRDGPSDPGSDD